MISSMEDETGATDILMMLSSEVIRNNLRFDNAI